MQTRERAHCARSVFPFIKKKTFHTSQLMKLPHHWGQKKHAPFLCSTHSLGCDTVSSFAGRGKATAFDTWKSFNAVTEVYSRLVAEPGSFNDNCMTVLESYVVLLVHITSVTVITMIAIGILCSLVVPLLTIP